MEKLKKISKKEIIEKMIESLSLDGCKFLISQHGYIYITHECECGHCDHCNGNLSKHIVVGHLSFENDKIERK